MYYVQIRGLARLFRTLFTVRIEIIIILYVFYFQAAHYFNSGAFEDILKNDAEKTNRKLIIIGRHHYWIGLVLTILSLVFPILIVVIIFAPFIVPALLNFRSKSKLEIGGSIVTAIAVAYFLARWFWDYFLVDDFNPIKFVHLLIILGAINLPLFCLRIANTRNSKRDTR